MTNFDRDKKFAIFGWATGQTVDTTRLRLSPEQKKAAKKNSEFASLIDLAQLMTGPGFHLTGSFESLFENTIIGY